jgi:hypothetical protein
MSIISRYKEAFSKPAFTRNVAEGVVLLTAALTLSFYAIQYASNKASNYVEDIILSNIPAYDVDWLFVYGTFAHMLIFVALLLYKPQRLPFALKGIALFYIIRSIFISLTHLGPYPIEIPPTPAPVLNSVFFAGDLFFSGHTGLPFLAALAFWYEPVLRYFYLASSLFFGTIVLLGHYHYSIDVLAAFFITYTIYVMAKWLFARDYELFMGAS